MGFMKFQSKNQMKLNFVQVGGKKRFIHFFESLFVKRFKTSYLNSGQGENTTKKWQKRNKSKKLMTIFFLFKKNKERIGQKSRTWTGEKLFTKNNIIFFEYFFFLFLVLSDISSQLFVFYYYFIWLGIFEIRERFKLQKRKKFLDQKIYHSMI